MPSIRLGEVQRLPTSGARAAAVFALDGAVHLAVPQLARDVPEAPPDMNGGDSDCDLLLYRFDGVRFVEVERLPAPGGEDAEFFRIGDAAFLAVASIRCGHGPYQYALESTIWRREGHRFVAAQGVPTTAAKQWRHFALGARHFLALAQGVEPGDGASQIFEWRGGQFVPFQTVASTWGYDWEFFLIDGTPFLAFADHLDRSSILRWSGVRFEPFATLEGGGGRAFCHFEADGVPFLAYANLLGDPRILRWDGTGFVPHQTLEGAGARKWLTFEQGGARWLVRVDFITGNRADPVARLQSTIYRWDGERMEAALRFETSGGTDAATFVHQGQRYLVVTNSLRQDIRFRVDSVVYAVDCEGSLS